MRTVTTNTQNVSSFRCLTNINAAILIVSIVALLNLLYWLHTVTPTGDDNVLYFYRPLSLALSGVDLSGLLADASNTLYPKVVLSFLVHLFEGLHLSNYLHDKLHLLHLVIVLPLFILGTLFYPRNIWFYLLFIYLPLNQVLLRSISNHSYSLIYGICALSLMIVYQSKQSKLLIFAIYLFSLIACLMKPTGYVVIFQVVLAFVIARSRTSLKSVVALALGALTSLIFAHYSSILGYAQSSASHEPISFSPQLIALLSGPFIGLVCGFLVGRYFNVNHLFIRLLATFITPWLGLLACRTIVHNHDSYLPVIVLIMAAFHFALEVVKGDRYSIYYRVSSIGITIGLILFDLYIGRTFYVFLFPLVVLYIPGLIWLSKQTSLSLLALLFFILFANQLWEDRSQKLYGNNHWVRFLTRSNFHDPFSWSSCSIPRDRLKTISELSKLPFSDGPQLFIHGSLHYYYSIQFDLNHKWVKDQVAFVSINRLLPKNYASLNISPSEFQNLEMWFDKRLIKVVILEDSIATKTNMEVDRSLIATEGIDLDLLESSLVSIFLSNEEIRNQFVEFHYSLPFMKLYVHKSLLLTNDK